jgi:hypothetical protein
VRFGSSSNYLGYQAGYNASQSYSSNFFGTQAGINTTFANNSNFFGTTLVIMRQVLITQILCYKLVVKQHLLVIQISWVNAGSGAQQPENSNFLGLNSGYQASTANNSNFFGILLVIKTSANNSTLLIGQCW